ncbi:GH11427 [Drosophila grimshawi]|uniref:GH11427 n=1 Tax=Drosophila grimshawi TaxID=7222 RepID=B4JAB2_DROGR|nr:GH11427 [Drosophila grimshawi]
MQNGIDSDDGNVGCLERTLQGLIPNEECLSYLKSLTCAKRPIKKKKKRRPKTVFDRFADPPFVIEPKTFIMDGCNGSCCHSSCHSCGCCASCWC